MIRIDLIAGARPNFMKIAPIIIALKAAQARGSELTYHLIRTGQHYDPALTRLLDGQWKDGEISGEMGRARRGAYCGRAGEIVK